MQNYYPGNKIILKTSLLLYIQQYCRYITKNNKLLIINKLKPIKQPDKLQCISHAIHVSYPTPDIIKCSDFVFLQYMLDKKPFKYLTN